MKYLFDNNIISDLYNINSGQYKHIAKKLTQLSNIAVLTHRDIDTKFK